MLTSAIRGIYPYPTLLRRGSQFPNGPGPSAAALAVEPLRRRVPLSPISIYIYIYIASESSMILSILRLNHGLFTWIIHGWIMAGCGATGEQHILLGKIIFLQCIVFCVGAELNRRDRVWIPTIFKCSVWKIVHQAKSRNRLTEPVLF